MTEALEDWRASAAALEDILAPVDEESPEFQAFLARCDEVAARIDAGLERTVPIKEVFDRLHTRLDRMIAAEGEGAPRRRRASSSTASPSRIAPMTT